MGRIGVSEGMDGGVFGEATPAHHHFEGLLECRRRQGRWPVARREQPGPGPRDLPILPHQLQDARGPWHEAVIAPLAIRDPNQHAGGVDIGYLQARAFRQAHTTGIDHAQAHLGLPVVDQPEHVPDLLNAQHYGEFLAFPGANKLEDRPRALQGALVKEADAVEMDT